jgi:CASC3/Barentsz eIF4AIII binding
LPSSADNEATLNGVKPMPATDGAGELHFDDPNVDNGQLETEPARPTDPQAIAPKAPRNETPAQRSRREHQEYIRQRNSNPAFVPNRGGFFLHDDRSSTATSSFNGRPGPRGRGRGLDQGFHGPYAASL